MLCFSLFGGEKGPALHTLCCITVAFVITLTCNAQSDVTPPTGVWCDAVPLGTTVPFAVVQPLWWKEYYVFNATVNGTIGFKLYAGMRTDEYFTVIVGVNYCTNILESVNYTSVYSRGTAEVLMNVDEGSAYVIFAHLPGANYTVIGCNGTCPKVCPNDCTNFQGVCDVPSKTCICNTGWTGDNCSIVYTNTTNGTTPEVRHHKIPFGSTPVFITVVAGLPTAVFITAVSVFFLYISYRKKEKKLKKKKKEKEPLIIPPNIPYTNGSNGHRNYGNGDNSISLSPAFPPLPAPPTPVIDADESSRISNDDVRLYGSNKYQER